MRKLLFTGALILALALVAGCASDKSGSREFIPGKGWVPA